MPGELVLAVETSTLRGGLALWQGGRIVGMKALAADRRQASELLPQVHELLAEAGARPADIALYCFSSGPGSFTGLRIAATLGTMLQSAIGCRVAAVSTLAVIARNLLAQPSPPERVAPLLDAKRGQIYAALYALPHPARTADGGGGTVSELVVERPAQVSEAGAWLAGLPPGTWLAGEGIARHRAAVDARGLPVAPEADWIPRAENVVVEGLLAAARGCCCAPHEIVPLYLRPPECEEVYEERRTAARARRCDG